MAREVPVAGASRFRDFRNGRKMWDLLPLWQEAEDRKERETGAAAKGGRAEQYGTTVLHRSFLPKGLRRPHPRDLPHGDKGRQDIHHKHYCCRDQGHCQR